MRKMRVNSELLHVDRPETLFLPLFHDHRLHKFSPLALERVSLSLLSEGTKSDCVWLDGFSLNFLFLFDSGQGLFKEFKLERIESVS